jgi:hypothetical protein
VGKTISDLELNLIAIEETLEFQTVPHNQSFQSMDCSLTIIQKLFEPKVHMCTNQVQAILVNVLSLLSITQVTVEPEDAKLISVMTVSSNH